MPAANHNFYLREFYNENKLARGEMTIAGTRARPRQGQAADLSSSPRKRRPHRAGAVGLSRLARCSAARSSSCWRARATSPASSIPPDKVKYQYWTNGNRRRQMLEEMAGGRQGASRLLVAALDQVADQALGRLDRRAQARQQARRHRGRAGHLREGAVEPAHGLAQPDRLARSRESRVTQPASSAGLLAQDRSWDDGWRHSAYFPHSIFSGLIKRTRLNSPSDLTCSTVPDTLNFAPLTQAA